MSKLTYKMCVSDVEHAALESIARRCARGVRACTTDDQYVDLLGRIVEALAFASGKIKANDGQKADSNG